MSGRHLAPRVASPARTLRELRALVVELCALVGLTRQSAMTRGEQ